MLIPGLSKWENLAIVVLAGGALLLGTWLHGRHNGIEREREKALIQRASALAIALEHQAEVAKVMGEAVRMAHERESIEIERRQQLARRVRDLQDWKQTQIDGSDACAAWAAAPVDCRLRPTAASGGSGSPGVDRAAVGVSAAADVGR